MRNPIKIPRSPEMIVKALSNEDLGAHLLGVLYGQERAPGVLSGNQINISSVAGMKESSPLSILHSQKAKRSLTFNQKFVIAIAALITPPVLLVLIFLVATDDVERKISGPVIVGPEWTEIRLDKPLKVSRRTQSVLLYVSDRHESYNELNDPSGTSWAMRFPDGSLVRPEVQLLDQYGSVYNLDSPSFLSKDRTSGELNAGMGFSTAFNVTIDSDLPNDRVYPLVRVRSEKPIHVSEIVWYCHTGK